MSQFNALFEPDEPKGFVVTFPDFEWGVTQGDTEEEATEMAVDALTMVIADYIEKGKELPAAAGKERGRKYRVIQLPALVSAKTELYRAFRASGIRKAELARRLGISKGTVPGSIRWKRPFGRSAKGLRWRCMMKLPESIRRTGTHT